MKLQQMVKSCTCTKHQWRNCTRTVSEHIINCSGHTSTVARSTVLTMILLMYQCLFFIDPSTVGCKQVWMLFYSAIFLVQLAFRDFMDSDVYSHALLEDAWCQNGVKQSSSVFQVCWRTAILFKQRNCIPHCLAVIQCCTFSPFHLFWYTAYIPFPSSTSF